MDARTNKQLAHLRAMREEDKMRFVFRGKVKDLTPEKIKSIYLLSKHRFLERLEAVDFGRN